MHKTANNQQLVQNTHTHKQNLDQGKDAHTTTKEFPSSSPLREIEEKTTTWIIFESVSRICGAKGFVVFLLLYSPIIVLL